YHLHRVTGFDLIVRPFLDNDDHGIFATRSPKRPNAIGLSVLELSGVDLARGVVRLCKVDILDGTPVLDIKPYVPYADAFPEARAGWIDAVDEATGLRSVPGLRRPR
ncbi:MAG: tRNA (N6-threonylcarbamoyladenosine(37)-N6)-methyltransferase TrmO, partial [Holophaga sp.]|nr:tRNA (N6-threonylcarbamoyladenosine(37)-N6)-methyltransferase TrmO [Holophaga sp.]